MNKFAFCSPQELCELYFKVIPESIRTDIILESQSLSGLLVEQTDEGDIKKIVNSVKQTRPAIKKALGTEYIKAFPSLEAYFSRVDDVLGAALNVATQIDLDDPEGMSQKFGATVTARKALYAVLDLQTKIVNNAGRIYDVIEKLQDNLDAQGVAAEMKFGELPADGPITLDMIKSGAKKALKGSDPGMFGKVAGFFKKMVKPPEIPGIDELPEYEFNDFIGDLDNASLKDLVGVLESMADPQDIPVPQDSIEDVVEEVEEETQQAEQGDAPQEIDKEQVIAQAKEIAGEAGELVMIRLLSDPTFLEKFGITLSEAFYRESLSSLLSEQAKLDFEDFEKVYAQISEENPDAVEDTSSVEIAKKINDAGDALDFIEIQNVVSGDAPTEDSETAQSELEDAAQDVVDQEVPPGIAIGAALDNWLEGMSATSQRSMQARGRFTSLKDVVNAALEDSAQAIEKEIESAIQTWRGEHEEALIRSRRFAKRNFDSLQDLIPQIASMMLKKTNESRIKLSKKVIHKSVYKLLNKAFLPSSGGLIYEHKRWEVLAGVRKIK